MSSRDEPKGPLSPLEALFREQNLDGALAARIRALVVEKPSMRVDESSTRPIVSHPPTRQGAPSRETVERVAQLLTQPARPTARSTDPEATPVAATTGPATWADFRPPEQSGPLLVPTALLGEGGMGEVHRARDVILGRDLAMKVLHGQFASVPRMRGRFLDEAQITAQLSHPSIPPVHSLGQLEDGRPFFTMKEVHGRTLAAILDADASGEAPLSEQRRLEIFQRVCEAVAYAHARGVIHCDLKPLNVMVGPFGEVLVMDWGVAHLVAPASSTTVNEPPVHTTANALSLQEVAGTPAYMPPEQALADVARIGPASDVYALGVMLYEILAGARPYQGGVPQLLFLAAQGQVPAIPRREGSAVDEALEAIIGKAMRPDPSERHHDAGALAEEVARWREGAMRREKAVGIVRAATERLNDVAPARALATALRFEADATLAAIPLEAGPDARREAWAKEDEARAHEQRADLGTAQVEQMLEAALVHAPELAVPKALLADLAFAHHRDAESRRAWTEAARHEVRLRAYDVGAYADYLAGRAKLTLATDVPAVAHLFHFVMEDRRLVPTPMGELGRTPLIAVELPIGSYLLELRTDDRPAMRVPFSLRRRNDCVFARPGSEEPTPLVIPPAGAIADDEVLVPAGWLCLGADPRNGAGERVWVDAFVMQRDPVTFADASRFLVSEAGAPFRDAVLRDGLGLFRPDWPAVGLSWEGARAYAAWRAASTGVAWRLPYELEWEKAARGADGRLYPWGDAEEPSFAHVRSGQRAPARPAPVQAQVYDVSAHGVRGMAGNVREWCADAFVGPTPGTRTPSTPFGRRIVRGGSYRLPLEAARASSHGALAASQGFVDVGFRLVRPL